MNWELSHIYISELKVAAFSCEVDDPVVSIWTDQFFNNLQLDIWSEPNTILSEICVLRTDDVAGWLYAGHLR